MQHSIESEVAVLADRSVTTNASTSSVVDYKHVAMSGQVSIAEPALQPLPEDDTDSEAIVVAATAVATDLEATAFRAVAAAVVAVVEAAAFRAMAAAVVAMEAAPPEAFQTTSIPTTLTRGLRASIRSRNCSNG